MYRSQEHCQIAKRPSLSRANVGTCRQCVVDQLSINTDLGPPRLADRHGNSKETET